MEKIIGLLKQVVGTRNERILRKFNKYVDQINLIESEFEKLSDADIGVKTDEFKQRLANGSPVESILAEAFALVREASKRALGLRHFDVQLLGGIVLHKGKIAEMRTGEGKTLAATLPAYLNALSGNGVHIVTVNDYLASRDAEWMRPVYELLGLTVGVNVANMTHEEKQAAYACDILYGTNNEFGFDYLRDNMVFSLDERVQRDLNFAIVDEVDSILIDEARTPLIISGQAEESSDLYDKIDKVIPLLKVQRTTEGEKEEDITSDRRGDYTVDEKSRQAHLTEQGHARIEELLVERGLLDENASLYDINNITLMHYLNAALRAHSLYLRDVHYVVKNDEVIIVDEHTGRLMEGRRWSEGLHQAVEAKEGVPVQLENQTLATITFQNYFRMYNKLGGMTGTADTEAFELQKIYGLEVIVVPTNKPMIRKDESDRIYMTQTEKYKAILKDIQDCQQRLQPVLVGTASIESSELVSNMLRQAGIKHEVLNAKQHEREAKIIAMAGMPGAVTIATNMAGRGTDIVLGGNLEVELTALENPSEMDVARIKKDWQERHDKVIKAGGLHVLATERNESRRIDNQLRGRSGRQGDPGSSQFYLSLEDNLLRIFAAERMAGMMRKLGIEEGEVIQHAWINKAIENAQRKVEGMNFDMRKQLLEYDDVANDQRKVVYQQRLELLKTSDISEAVKSIRKEAITHMVRQYIPQQSLEEQWDVPNLEQRIKDDFNLELGIKHWLAEDETLHDESLLEKIIKEINESYAEKEEQADVEVLREVEKNVMLQLLDTHWKDHLAGMDHLRQSIHLRGYAQKSPVQEYKRECFEMFAHMVEELKYEFISTLARLEIATEEQLALQNEQVHQLPELHFQHAEMASLTSGETVTEDADERAADAMQPFKRSGPKLGRNDPCHCGSGKKYKQCHGRLT